ncbi:hypothetical protein MtrunA17_Chr1g0180681 [Medicago truncatula]|uniref:Uncharacterized protein n=1 Tax=Medicago truncatula TaxID=3880 RepID=A0A396JYP9_MEDTR|nr:hypothetical protein MtrunA17_Chr1g0180681 [Medicago truncatula]
MMSFAFFLPLASFQHINYSQYLKFKFPLFSFQSTFFKSLFLLILLCHHNLLLSHYSSSPSLFFFTQHVLKFLHIQPN